MAELPVYNNEQVIAALRWGYWDRDPVYYALDHNNQMTDAMVSSAIMTFELWDDVIAIDLELVANTRGSHIEFSYASEGGGGSFANRRHDGRRLKDADVKMDPDWPSQNDDADLYFGGFALLNYLHEIGHALGLDHPSEYSDPVYYSTDADYQQDTRQYTVMSYFNAGADGSGVDHYKNGGFKYASTPLLHDILAIQSIYGADMTTRVGDTVYGYNSNAGRDVYDFTKNLHPIMAIWDAGGVDTLDFSGFRGFQRIDLREGKFSTTAGLTENVAIAYGTIIENAIGGARTDVMIGNAAPNRLEGRDDQDWIMGGKNSDTLIGGAGDDVLDGGSGGDLFDGGPGEDLLRFAGAPGGVRADLRAGEGTHGNATGDVYIGMEHISGSLYSDTLIGGELENQLRGRDGNDLIRGFGEGDFLRGENGDDKLHGGEGNDIIVGGAGADLIDGGSGSDWAYYRDASGSIGVHLGIGVGSLAEAEQDRLIDIESVWGGDFDDWLQGDDGANILRGGNGDDTIVSGSGQDTLQGEGGADTFRFGASSGMDRIVDFDPGTDRIEFTSDAAMEFADLKINDFRGDASVVFGSGDAVLLLGLSVGDISEDFFVFI